MTSCQRYVYDTTAADPRRPARLLAVHDAGVYDNRGYRLRAPVCDDEGRFAGDGPPGLYTDRAIPSRAQAPNQPVLHRSSISETNRPTPDGIFDPALVMDMEDAADGKLAFFTFVLSR